MHTPLLPTRTISCAVACSEADSPQNAEARNKAMRVALMQEDPLGPLGLHL
jgi:hypothetical protein